MLKFAWRSIVDNGQREAEIESQLRLIEEPRQPLRFPSLVETEVSAPADITLIAEMRTKRYPLVGCDEERYTAKLQVESRSPLVLLRALLSEMEKVEHLASTTCDDEPFILELQLRAL